MDKCYMCQKFLQDSDPSKPWCSGGPNCYELAGFPEYEPKDEKGE